MKEEIKRSGTPPAIPMYPPWTHQLPSSLPRSFPRKGLPNLSDDSPLRIPTRRDVQESLSSTHSPKVQIGNVSIAAAATAQLSAHLPLVRHHHLVSAE